MRFFTVHTLRLLALAGLTQALLACGGSAVTSTQRDSATVQKAPAAEGAKQTQEELTDEDFQVRHIEEVKAPRYLLGIDHEAQDLFRQGIVSVLAQPPRYKLGESKFRAAIQRDSKFLEAYFNLGMSLERQGKSEAALNVYKDALSASPDDISAQAYIAKIYLGKARRAELLGDTPEYEGWLSKTKTLLDELAPRDPENVTVNNGLALYWLLQGDVETASQKVKEVLYVEPRNVTGLNTRGLINLKEGNYLIAEWIFKNKVLAEDPNSTEALTNLGYTYIHLDQRPLAMRYFKKALVQDAENMEVRMNIAAMLLEHLNYTEANDHYAKVFAAQPLNMEALEGLCDSAYGMGGGAADAKAQFKRGIDCYLKLIAQRPEKSHLYKRIATTYQHKLEDLDTAVEYFASYLKHATVEKKERAVVTNTIKMLKDIISKGGLKAMLAAQQEAMPPMDEDEDDSTDEDESSEGDDPSEDGHEPDGEDTAPVEGESTAPSEA